MIEASDAAKYFLYLAQQNDDDSISNMKLQKLLYYAQGFYLAIFDTELFSERLEKWVHGPVVPSIYHAYKQFGNQPIPYEGDLDVDNLDTDARELLDEVYEVIGQFSAYVLRNKSHKEPPWQNAVNGGYISNTVLRDYFKTRLVDAEET